MPPSTSRHERVFRSLMRAADHLLRAEVEALREEELTFAQYNVLRILRGARPERLSCGAIAERMVTRDSDLTRLLDRLEGRGLVERGRDAADRRVVTAAITADGLRVLRGLDAPVDAALRAGLSTLSVAQLDALHALTEAIVPND